MKGYSSFFCILLIIMLTHVQSVNSQTFNNTITITPMDRIVSNVAANKQEPIEGHVLKNISIVENDLFSVYIDLSTSGRFIKITSFTTNIDFIRFRRDKNNGYITFKSFNSGKGRIAFQIDSEDSVIKKYIYTINITNNITNTSPVVVEEENVAKPIKNINNNITKPAATSTEIKPIESSIKKVSSANTVPVKKKLTQNVNNNNNIPTPTMPTPPKVPTPPLFAQSTILQNDNTDNSSINSDNVFVGSQKDEDILLYKMAEDFRLSKSYDNAIKTYSDIITRYPNSTNVLNSKIKLAEVYTIKKDYNNAYNTFKSIYDDKISKDNEKAYALYSMGLVKKIDKDYLTAKDNFMQVINQYPESTYRYDAAYDYAHTLSLEKKLSDGMSILEDAIAKSNNFQKRDSALILLGEIYERGNREVRDYQKAYDTYMIFLREYPNSRLANEINNRREFIQRNYLNLR